MDRLTPQPENEFTPDDERLSAYLDGELNSADQARLEERLCHDAELRQLIEELRAVRLHLEVLPEFKLSPDFAVQVLRRAELEILAGTQNSPATTAASAPITPLGESQPLAAAASPADTAPAAGSPQPTASPLLNNLNRRPWLRPALWTALAAAAGIMILLTNSRPPAVRDEIAVKETTRHVAVKQTEELAKIPAATADNHFEDNHPAAADQPAPLTTAFGSQVAPLNALRLEPESKLVQKEALERGFNDKLALHDRAIQAEENSAAAKKGEPVTELAPGELAAAEAKSSSRGAPRQKQADHTDQNQKIDEHALREQSSASDGNSFQRESDAQIRLHADRSSESLVEQGEGENRQRRLALNRQAAAQDFVLVQLDQLPAAANNAAFELLLSRHRINVVDPQTGRLLVEARDKRLPERELNFKSESLEMPPLQNRTDAAPLKPLPATPPPGAAVTATDDVKVQARADSPANSSDAPQPSAATEELSVYVVEMDRVQLPLLVEQLRGEKAAFSQVQLAAAPNLTNPSIENLVVRPLLRDTETTRLKDNIEQPKADLKVTSDAQQREFKKNLGQVQQNAAGKQQSNDIKQFALGKPEQSGAAIRRAPGEKESGAVNGNEQAKNDAAPSEFKQSELKAASEPASAPAKTELPTNQPPSPLAAKEEWDSKDGRSADLGGGGRSAQAGRASARFTLPAAPADHDAQAQNAVSAAAPPAPEDSAVQNHRNGQVAAGDSIQREIPQPELKNRATPGWGYRFKFNNADKFAEAAQLAQQAGAASAPNDDSAWQLFWFSLAGKQPAVDFAAPEGELSANAGDGGMRNAPQAEDSAEKHLAQGAALPAPADSQLAEQTTAHEQQVAIDGTADKKSTAKSGIKLPAPAISTRAAVPPAMEAPLAAAPHATVRQNAQVNGNERIRVLFILRRRAAAQAESIVEGKTGQITSRNEAAKAVAGDVKDNAGGAGGFGGGQGALLPPNAAPSAPAAPAAADSGK